MSPDRPTSATDTVVLTIRGLSVSATGTGHQIIHDLDLDLHRGEILALVGESGSGKTTVGLACLNHFRTGLAYTGGEITLYPRTGDTPINVLELADDRVRTLRGERIAYIPQDPALSLNPAMRVGDQIREVLDIHSYGSSDSERAERVAEVLRDVDLPDTESYQRRWPHQLSGGQQQRIGIAMAFSMNPDVLVLDEPTTGLDVSTQAHVLDTIREMTARHDVASLYITHDLAVVAELAHRVAVMLRGDLVEIGDWRKILNEPDHPYTQRLLRAVPDLAGKKNLTETNQAPAITEPSTAAQGQSQPQEKSRPSQHLLAVRELRMSYGSHEVLKAINLTIDPGESTLLLGESGSGKTTLARSIAGLNPDYTGTIQLRGQALEHRARNRSLDARQDIQYIFQSPFSSLNPRQSIGKSLTVPLRMSQRLPSSQHRAVVEETLEAVQLDPSFYDRRPGDLSGGERQRAAIARALVNAPSMLVCDEITSALDVSVQASILALLNQLRHQRGLALLFVTHNIALARHIATQVAVLNQGEIVDHGPVNDVLDNPSHSYTRHLLDDLPQL
ncbi:peptide ABC transporter ATP-binding protein [Auritidibacter sp. NML120779]|nr:peptide ABC transporter ATP-binding protein [Auritidibacter sp. NML120779]